MLQKTFCKNVAKGLNMILTQNKMLCFATDRDFIMSIGRFVVDDV